MGAICNGMATCGLRPYGATFFVFSDYMRPAIRMSAIMELPSLFIFTHDSIGVGEDGPTHQPVEQLAALRAIPGLIVLLRPTRTKFQRPTSSLSTSSATRGGWCSRGRTCRRSIAANMPRRPAHRRGATCSSTPPTANPT